MRFINLLFSFCLLFGLFSCQKSQSPPPTNVILIVADYLGSADLGAYGQTAIKTPHLDRLAKEGVLLTQAYSGNTVEAAAQGSLLTGLHSGHHPIRKNSSRVPLPENIVTMAEVFQSAGYATGGFGKWLLGGAQNAKPLQYGFDDFFGYHAYSEAVDYYPDFLWKNDQQIKLSGEDGSAEAYSPYRIYDEMSQFVSEKARAKQAFFCYVPMVLPHAPYAIPKSDSNWMLYASKDWTEERKQYAAMLSLLDQQVGTLLELLIQLKVREHTLIVFCSNNSADRTFAAYQPNGQLRGFQSDLYQGGLRIPMIANWPGMLPAGQEVKQPIYFPDLLPTLAEVANIRDLPLALDGRSFFKLLKDPKSSWKDRFLYWEYQPNDVDEKVSGTPNYQQALLYRQWKMMRNHQEEEWVIYDLQNDPGETDNVAAYHPGKMGKFIEWIKKNRVDAK